MTADISRHSLRPAQNFTGVVRQQGRVPLDADETESDDLASLALRQMVAETICARGSPDDGFTIGPPTFDGEAIDFPIAAGTFYLGGARLESLGHSYDSQPDGLTFPLDDPGPDAPEAGRHDLVWLQGWEQTVTATEDSELFERALGGPDTTARRRMMWRVQVMQDAPDDCVEAFDELVDEVFEGGVLDPEGCEILSEARLTIGFTQLEPLEDLCRPGAQQGFLGARNEAFRIQVTGPGRFVWGRDNAAPLYRVQVATDEAGARRRIAFLTLPRDEFGWPLAGMTVELLRWGSLLANQEKAAEPSGLLLRVGTGYDPQDRSILVLDDVPPEWDAWFATAEGQAAVNPRDEDDAQAYFFLRVWTGGGAGAAVDHAMDIGNPVELGETGLTATFDGPGLAGDYWIVSARPNTPTLVTPWALLDGAPPAGPRRLIAPLALLRWTSVDSGEVIDCRHRFRPLCEVGTCCRVTVGDGRHTFGDVTSIQEAVNRLPEEGGEICIHPGEYEEHVVIDGRRNITLTGCGRLTLWLGEDAREEPLLTILGSSNITVRRLAMASDISESVFAEEVALGVERRRLTRVVLEDLAIACADTAGVRIAGGTGHVVRRCQVLLEPLSLTLGDDPVVGRAAAVFLSGDDLLIEHCRIGLDTVFREQPAIEASNTLSGARTDAFTAFSNRARLAVGGVHIGGGSRAVIIRDNLIRGGNGHGITLGSVQFVPEVEEGFVLTPQADDYTTFARNNYRKTAGYGSGAVEYTGLTLVVDDGGCINLPGTPPGSDDVPIDEPLFPESGGLLQDVRILRNEITDMGFSGISAHMFSGLGRDGFSDAVAVELIEIAENRILRCMINEVGETTALLRQFIGWGGIALSICQDATIRDNFIAENGRHSADAIVGVFIAIAEDVKIERNRIERNGMTPGATPLAPGRRGGIVIGVAIGGLSTFSELEGATREADRPALIVAGNMVDAPSGRALKAILLGPGIVLGNRLTGAGRSALFSNVFGSLVAGGLALSIVGDQLFAAREDIDLIDYVMLELLSDVLGGDAVNVVSLCVAEDLLLIQNLDDAGPQRLRGGELLMNDNQISLRRHSSEFGVSVSAVTLLGADDISFCDNQVEVENEVQFILTNTLAISGTLRVSSNRLQERVFAGILSAVTFAMMNQTASNQTTHCILAVGWPQARVVTANRSVLGLFNAEICAALERFAAAFSETLGAQSGVGLVAREPVG